MRTKATEEQLRLSQVLLDQQSHVGMLPSLFLVLSFGLALCLRSLTLTSHLSCSQSVPLSVFPLFVYLPALKYLCLSVTVFLSVLCCSVSCLSWRLCVSLSLSVPLLLYCAVVLSSLLFSVEKMPFFVFHNPCLFSLSCIFLSVGPSRVTMFPSFSLLSSPPLCTLLIARILKLTVFICYKKVPWSRGLN